jgi:hypothetical protein
LRLVFQNHQSVTVFSPQGGGAPVFAFAPIDFQVLSLQAAFCITFKCPMRLCIKK